MAVDVMLSMPVILHGSKDWMAVQQGGSTTGQDRNGRQECTASCSVNTSSLISRCLGGCIAGVDQTAPGGSPGLADRMCPRPDRPR